MEITCWGYKKSLPVVYNWSNHTSLRVIFHLERVTECHSINPGQPPPNLKLFCSERELAEFSDASSVTKLRKTNCGSVSSWEMVQKTCRSISWRVMWKNGTFLTIDAEIIIMYLCGDVRWLFKILTAELFWMPPSQGSLFLIFRKSDPLQK